MLKNHVGYYQKLSSARPDFMISCYVLISWHPKSLIVQVKTWRKLKLYWFTIKLGCFCICEMQNEIIFTKWGVVTTNFTIWINWKSVSILRIRIVYFGWGGVPYFVTCLNIELMWLSLPTIFHFFFNRRIPRIPGLL